jgi:hypothetical protein
MEYIRNFKKTVWGYATVDAKNPEEARQKFDNGDTDDEFDNKSDYDWENEITPLE